MPGLDGEKCPNYNNYISLREAPDSVDRKSAPCRRILRVRKIDPATLNSVQYIRCTGVFRQSNTGMGARLPGAAMGCTDCGGLLIDSVNAEQEIIRQRAQQLDEDADLVNTIIQEGSEKARSIARETLDDKGRESRHQSSKMWGLYHDAKAPAREHQYGSRD